jgi:hypothetical protein
VRGWLARGGAVMGSTSNMSRTAPCHTGTSAHRPWLLAGPHSGRGVRPDVDHSPLILVVERDTRRSGLHSSTHHKITLPQGKTKPALSRRSCLTFCNGGSGEDASCRSPIFRMRGRGRSGLNTSYLPNQRLHEPWGFASRSYAARKALLFHGPERQLMQRPEIQEHGLRGPELGGADSRLH